MFKKALTLVGSNSTEYVLNLSLSELTKMSLSEVAVAWMGANHNLHGLACIDLHRLYTSEIWYSITIYMGECKMVIGYCHSFIACKTKRDIFELDWSHQIHNIYETRIFKPYKPLKPLIDRAFLTPKLSICWNVIAGCERKFTNSTDIYDGMNIIWCKWISMLVRRIFIGGSHLMIWIE